jgi:hypothetical protein
MSSRALLFSMAGGATGPRRLLASRSPKPADGAEGWGEPPMPREPRSDPKMPPDSAARAAAERSLVAAGVEEERGIVVPHRLEVGLDQFDRDDRPTVVVRVVQAVGGERRGSDVVVREMVLAQKLVGRRVPHGFDHRVAQPVGPDEERLLGAAVADLVDQQAELGPGPEERLVQIEQVGEVRVLDDLDR